MRVMTSPDLRATKPSAAIRIRLAAANESSFKRLRIDALADENLWASARGVRTVRTVRARCERLLKRLRNRSGARCDTVLALPYDPPPISPPKSLTNPLSTPRFSTPPCLFSLLRHQIRSLPSSSSWRRTCGTNPDSWILRSPEAASQRRICAGLRALARGHSVAKKPTSAAMHATGSST